MADPAEGLTATRGLSPDLPHRIIDMEAQARAKMPPENFDYFLSGAADEITLARNHRCFEELRLKPRVLVDVSRLDTVCELFGQRHDFPLLLAPTAVHGLAHPNAERETAKGAESANATLVASLLSNVTIEEITAASTARVWFQLFVQSDRGLTRQLIERAEAAGCTALCLTVDMPVIGPRRSGIAPPGYMANVASGRINPGLFDRSVTWSIVGWIRSFTKLPIILKGILAAEDARIAVDEGASGIWVSNHGARQLDTVPATIEALPGVAAAVKGRVPILLDGGVRRGTDIYKALALGANAVLVGRPYVWGLAVGGAAGVRQVVQILRNELELTMALCGTPRLADIGPASLW